ncbi:AMP-binding enzyme family protein [Paraburkholderia xenovorans LB400]|uniref:AMP-dependent synthetase and ligase n=1 Tax=Paraburkholderia xenovorans (strain LB400) TaxID=266265 RepID=Q13GP3_PARXL|nr:AMP-binding protein [Paraburkholderia xenovorans]ABE36746.1 Putative AMP-dependent synthetase and ligase [Paraburkholderia xenovorans LB400]AIP34489.1 AMP-binding enzyme family protein [Paraburkholderia xenovorans LB400]
MNDLNEFTYPHFLARQRRERPEGLAVSTPGHQATWRQLAIDVERHGAALQSLGIIAGAKVGILMPNGYEWVVWAYAAASIGAVVVPLNTRFLAAELAYQLATADIEILVLSPIIGDTDFLAIVAAMVPALSEAQPGAWRSETLPRLRHIVTTGTSTTFVGELSAGSLTASPIDPAAIIRVHEAAAKVKPDDPVLIQFTSGSTALPKGAMLSHQSTLRNAHDVAARLHITHADRIFVPGPFFHVGGLTLGMLLGLSTGAPIHTLARFDPAAVLATIAREQITVYSGVDSLFITLYKYPGFRREAIASVTKGWIASSPDIVRMVQTEMGLTGISNVFGISEASPNVTIGDLDEPPALRAATCGRPHPGCEVKIVDPATGETVPAGESGEILYRGYSLMLGYYNNPAATAKAIDVDGWLHTGDRGILRASGHLEYHGRIKDMLRVGGENLAPAEVEEALCRHPKVRQAAVIGLPDERLVEVPAAVVELKEGETCSAEEITAWCAARLAAFKVPRVIAFVEQMPMTGSGKIQKTRMKQEVFGISTSQ